jgi:diaminohydroxyphosphoribosylaminopyrimidine deaminase/5-amino-6-(5-phosphoribosylamino)uracil reductase
VGRGYHARAGEAHAEVRALEEAGKQARGATLVSTLEPCAHQGRTPPCVEAILASGLRRVVLGMRDPNPLVNGRGVQALGRAGLTIVEGVREDECRKLNPPYLKFLATGLPWVMLKSMVSLDGRVASEGGDSRGLGGEEQQRLHGLRAGTTPCSWYRHGAGQPGAAVGSPSGGALVRVVLDSRLHPRARCVRSLSQRIGRRLDRDRIRMRSRRRR